MEMVLFPLDFLRILYSLGVCGLLCLLIQALFFHHEQSSGCCRILAAMMSWWLFPPSHIVHRRKLRKQGIDCPPPSSLFYGNGPEMQEIIRIAAKSATTPWQSGDDIGAVCHDFTASLFPYFEQWAKKYEPALAKVVNFWKAEGFYPSISLSPQFAEGVKSSSEGKFISTSNSKIGVPFSQFTVGHTDLEDQSPDGNHTGDGIFLDKKRKFRAFEDQLRSKAVLPSVLDLALKKPRVDGAWISGLAELSSSRKRKDFVLLSPPSKIPCFRKSTIPPNKNESRLVCTFDLPILITIWICFGFDRRSSPDSPMKRNQEQRKSGQNTMESDRLTRGAYPKFNRCSSSVGRQVYEHLGISPWTPCSRQLLTASNRWNRILKTKPSHIYVANIFCDTSYIKYKGGESNPPCKSLSSSVFGGMSATCYKSQPIAQTYAQATDQTLARRTSTSLYTNHPCDSTYHQVKVQDFLLDSFLESFLDKYRGSWFFQYLLEMNNEKDTNQKGVEKQKYWIVDTIIHVLVLKIWRYWLYWILKTKGLHRVVVKLKTNDGNITQHAKLQHLHHLPFMYRGAVITSFGHLTEHHHQILSPNNCHFGSSDDLTIQLSSNQPLSPVLGFAFWISTFGTLCNQRIVCLFWLGRWWPCWWPSVKMVIVLWYWVSLLITPSPLAPNFELWMRVIKNMHVESSFKWKHQTKFQVVVQRYGFLRHDYQVGGRRLCDEGHVVELSCLILSIKSFFVRDMEGSFDVAGCGSLVICTWIVPSWWYQVRYARNVLATLIDELVHDLKFHVGDERILPESYDGEGGCCICHWVVGPVLRSTKLRCSSSQWLFCRWFFRSWRMGDTMIAPLWVLSVRKTKDVLAELIVELVLRIKSQDGCKRFPLETYAACLFRMSLLEEASVKLLCWSCFRSLFNVIMSTVWSVGPTLYDT